MPWSQDGRLLATWPARLPIRIDRWHVKTHGNTLYVTTQDAYLAKEDEAVVVRVEGQMRMRIPVHTLGGIVCFGQVSCSPALMHLCAERSVAISFLSEHGRFLARPSIRKGRSSLR